MFAIDTGPLRFRYYDDRRVVAIVYEISSDKASITREEYGVFDLLSDLGGMTGIIHTIGLVVTVAFTFDGAQHFVTASLLNSTGNNKDHIPAVSKQV